MPAIDPQIACAGVERRRDMGRQVRRVPLDWQHPTDAHGQYIPLFKGPYEERRRRWEEGKAKWAEGLRENLRGEWIPRAPDEQERSYEDGEGQCPQPEDYMPAFTPEDCVGWQLYETTSEGTPISPVFETPEALARWLAETGASSFARMTASYEQWLAMIHQGYAPSAVLADGELVSGVQATPPLHQPSV
jgi:hypothetical protein